VVSPVGVGVTRFTLRVLGFPILSVDMEQLELVYEDDESSIGGGSGHNFTLAEPFVDERYLPWEDEDRAGFGFRGGL
jgi:hypothetical protein